MDVSGLSWWGACGKAKLLISWWLRKRERERERERETEREREREYKRVCPKGHSLQVPFPNFSSDSTSNYEPINGFII
jgi:hypothetical protein